VLSARKKVTANAWVESQGRIVSGGLKTCGAMTPIAGGKYSERDRWHLLPDDRTVDSADLAKMINILAHRGPDGSNTWSSGMGGIECSGRHPNLLELLPLVNQTGDLAITADARIDNRDELIAALALTIRKITDSQLILAAYEKWGDHCPEQLLGDFAFAIWNGRQQVLFCAEITLESSRSTTIFWSEFSFLRLKSRPPMPAWYRAGSTK